MYKVNIEGVKINSGRLSVDVTFSSDEDTFNDTFETAQYQDDSWIGEQIKRRLSHLNSLYALKDSIEVGPFHEKVKAKSEKDLYLEKKMLYLNYMSEARLGIIKYDRPIIAELLEWLRANWKDEYIS